MLGRAAPLPSGPLEDTVSHVPAVGDTDIRPESVLARSYRRVERPLAASSWTRVRATSGAGSSPGGWCRWPASTMPLGVRIECFGSADLARLEAKRRLERSAFIRRTRRAKLLDAGVAICVESWIICHRAGGVDCSARAQKDPVATNLARKSTSWTDPPGRVQSTGNKACH